MPSNDFVPRSRPGTHWARPIFLHYNCLYNYMTSYYDDEIDYLNKKQRGLTVEPPKAKSWGERALRLQMQPRITSPISWETVLDPSTHTLLHTAHFASSAMSVTSKHQKANRAGMHHTTNYYNRKYRSIL